MTLGIFCYPLPRSGPKPAIVLSLTFQKRQELLWNKKLQSFCHPPKIPLVAALAKVVYGTKGIRCRILLIKLSPASNVAKCNWVVIFFLNVMSLFEITENVWSSMRAPWASEGVLRGRASLYNFGGKAPMKCFVPSGKNTFETIGHSLKTLGHIQN